MTFALGIETVQYLRSCEPSELRQWAYFIFPEAFDAALILERIRDGCPP